MATAVHATTNLFHFNVKLDFNKENQQATIDEAAQLMARLSDQFYLCFPDSATLMYHLVEAGDGGAPNSLEDDMAWHADLDEVPNSIERMLAIEYEGPDGDGEFELTTDVWCLAVIRLCKRCGISAQFNLIQPQTMNLVTLEYAIDRILEDWKLPIPPKCIGWQGAGR